MKKLEIPLLEVEEVFKTCISNIRNRDLKARLSSCTNLVVAASEELEQKMADGSIHAIIRETLVNGNVTAQELKKVYTNGMVPKAGAGRSLYDEILIAPSHGICPYCSQRGIKNLDHYLPKAQYPRLSTVPINLVPSCSDCNKDKLNSYPKTPDEESFHPYFDDVDSAVWLKAEVQQGLPVTIIFICEPPEEWSNSLKTRVINHFKDAEIGDLYSTQASVELSNIIHRLKNILENSGYNELQLYLKAEAESRILANKNSWRSALYLALSTNNWFLNGGFK